MGHPGGKGLARAKDLRSSEAQRSRNSEQGTGGRSGMRGKDCEGGMEPLAGASLLQPDSPRHHFFFFFFFFFAVFSLLPLSHNRNSTRHHVLQPMPLPPHRPPHPERRLTQ